MIVTTAMFYATLLGVPVGAAAPESTLCSVQALRELPGYMWTVGHIESFVTDAETVVRATALAEDGSRFGPAAREGSGVLFRIEETLRGSAGGETFWLRGQLVETDDFNRSDVPYRMVRPSGQRGSCSTFEYRAGAEYLLLLRTGRAGLETAGAALAPVNEQVRGADDPWVSWVREVLRSGAAGNAPAAARY